MTNSLHTKTCRHCGSLFSCGASLIDENCWCGSFPAILPVPAQGECLCETCLKKEISSNIDDFVSRWERGEEEGFDMKRFQTDHLVEGLDYYMEAGFYVFTKWYHLKRGHCCNSGCRHCPYRDRK